MRCYNRDREHYSCPLIPYEDAEGTVARTGRTNNLARREAEHGRANPDKTFAVDKRTDSKAAQRGREQDLHDQNPSAHAKMAVSTKLNQLSQVILREMTT